MSERCKHGFVVIDGWHYTSVDGMVFPTNRRCGGVTGIKFRAMLCRENWWAGYQVWCDGSRQCLGICVVPGVMLIVSWLRR